MSNSTDKASCADPCLAAARSEIRGDASDKAANCLAEFERCFQKCKADPESFGDQPCVTVCLESAEEILVYDWHGCRGCWGGSVIPPPTCLAV